jgi:hypothetical protein
MLTITIKGLPPYIDWNVTEKLVQSIAGWKYGIYSRKTDLDEAEYKVQCENRLKQVPTMAADIRKAICDWLEKERQYGDEGFDTIVVTVTEVNDPAQAGSTIPEIIKANETPASVNTHQ